MAPTPTQPSTHPYEQRQHEGGLESVAAGGLGVDEVAALQGNPIEGLAAYARFCVPSDDARLLSCRALPGHRHKRLTAAEVRKRFDLRWWRGGHALLLQDVEQLPFVRCPGALNTWRVPEPVLAVLERLGCRFDAAGQLRRAA